MEEKEMWETKMKKKILFILLLSFAVISLNAARINATMSIEAKEILGSLELKEDFEKVYLDSGPYYAMKYNDKTSKFIDLGRLSLDSIKNTELYKNGYTPGSTNEIFSKPGNYIQLSSYDVDKEGICTSFVDAVSNFEYGESSKYGDRLEPGMYVKAGTVIASHARLDPLDSGHIAILLRVKNNYIEVIDQNAKYRTKDKGGILAIHRIKFGDLITDKNSDEYYKQGNAYNYHIVKVNEWLLSII